MLKETGYDKIQLANGTRSEIVNAIDKLSTFEPVVVTDENSVVYKDFNGVLQKIGGTNEGYTVENIETLKGLVLKVGDVVQVLGYYEKGDGAHHLRKIATEDDGSGVQLIGGLWANIVHNGEVNVSWFGAKGDGVTDDTESIQKAINFVSVVDMCGTTIKNEVKIKLSKKHLITDTIMLSPGVFVEGILSSVAQSTEPFTTSAIITDNRMNNKDVFVTPVFSKTQNKFIEPGYRTATLLFNSNEYWVTTNVKLKNFSIVYNGDKDFAPNWGVRLEGSNGTTLSKINIIGLKAGISNTGSWSVDVRDCRTYTHFVGYYSEGCTHGLLENFYHSGREPWNTFVYWEAYNFLPFCLRIANGIGDGKVPFGQETVGASLYLTSILVSNSIFENIKNGIAIETGSEFNPTLKNNYIENCETLYNLYLAIDFSLEIGTSVIFKNFIKGYTDKKIVVTPANSSEIQLNTQNFDLCTNTITMLGFAKDFDLYSSRIKEVGAEYLKNIKIKATEFELLSHNQQPYGHFVASSKDNIEGVIPWVGIAVSSGSYINHNSDFSWLLGMLNNRLFFKEKSKTSQGSWKKIAIDTISTQLDTPYYATKMQQLGIYEDFISYMDSQHEYDKEQKSLETTKQEAYQLALSENSELKYEDWLSSYVELLPVLQEPIPSEALQAFYNEYK